MVTDNLPKYMTPFIGRQGEIADISGRLREPYCRLLTLTGPGGSGKTRLAIEVAKSLAPDGGVYFVPLQPLQAADNIVTAMIDTLPLQLTDNDDPRQRLLDYLREKHLLLVLDNFEHLLDGTDIVTDILAATTQVQLLVTSRERLNLQAERVWPVRGLDVPDDSQSAPDRHSAVQLFVERAQRLQPDFSLDEHHDAVIRICQLVDGLPLALELATGWTRVLSCEAIADEIQRNIDLLATGHRDMHERHRSMGAVFDHSWSLLSDTERAALPRLAVFRGGFTAEAAAQVAGALLPTLASLIDKSLVQMGDNGRYSLHELLRQYAEAQLIASDGVEMACDAHSAYYANYLFTRIEDLKGRRQLPAIAEISADFENVRSAWNWAVFNKNEALIKSMIDGLWIFCSLYTRKKDSYALFQYAESQLAPAQGQAPGRTWGRLLARATVGKNSRSKLEVALELAQRANDRAEIAFCLSQTALLIYTKENHEDAKQLLERSLMIYRQLEDDYAVAGVLWMMLDVGYEVYYEDFMDLGERYGEESLRIRRAIGDHVGIAWSIIVTALQAGRLGHFAEAERLWLERVTLGQKTGNLVLEAIGFAHISHKVYFIQGNFTRARDTADEALRLGIKTDTQNAIGWALASLGLLACMDENYVEGKRLCQQGVEEGRHGVIAELAAWGLAIAASGLEDYVAAGENLLLASRFLTTILGPVGMIGSLPIGAIILAHAGQITSAVELLALAYTHPIKAAGWMKKWSLLERLQADLRVELGETAYVDAWERGAALDLDSTYQKLLQTLKSEQAAPNLRVIAPLADPLSPRELEVLQLIMADLTNREIGDRLHIGINTVKKHVNHIYSKLDVKNRTEAVDCANKLGLIV